MCFLFSQSLERNISYIGDESVTYTQIRKVIFDDKNSGSHKKTDRVKIPNPALVVSWFSFFCYIDFASNK